ncbi:MAG: autotransporter-associated beta strand repeat-containing protein [Planctomycetia bacterium]|nr:autotransporter-associated beta strand repeat-containing protein [Planctomycetia bacterium]
MNNVFYPPPPTLTSVRNFLWAFFFLSSWWGCGILSAAPLEVGLSEPYTFSSTTVLNEALEGYDSLLKKGDSTVTLTLDSAFIPGTSDTRPTSELVKIAVSQISVEAGELRIESTDSQGGGPRHLFTGTIDVATGATLFLNAKDALGYEDTAENGIILNVSGTLKLIDGTNQTMRRVTLNLSGATVTGGQYQYRIPATGFNVISGNNTFSSQLHLRANAAIDVADSASIRFTTEISNEVSSGNPGAKTLTKTGGGTMIFAAKNTYAGLTTISAGRLQSGVTDAILPTSDGLHLGGAWEMDGYSQTLTRLSGTGSITNLNSSQTSVLTLNTTENLSANLFSGSIGTGIDVVKTGTGTWYLGPVGDSGKVDWGVSDFQILAGKVVKSTRSVERFLSGTIFIGSEGVLELSATDALGGSSTVRSPLTIDIAGTLSMTQASGNQTSRYITYNLYGGTLQAKNLLFIAGTETSIASKATLHGTAVTKTALLEGNLTTRGNSVVVLDVEDGLSEIDLYWKDARFQVENLSAASSAPLEKTGAGTLKISGNLEHTGGTTVRAGGLVLESAQMNGNLTIMADSTFSASQNSSVGRLLLDGEFLIDLENLDFSGDNLAVSEFVVGESASLEIDMSGDLSLMDYDGLRFLTVEENSASVFAALSQLLQENPAASHYFSFSLREGGSIHLSVDHSAVPEPGSFWLLGLGFLLAGWSWQQRKKEGKK